jgi:hypothetical protein
MVKYIGIVVLGSILLIGCRSQKKMLQVTLVKEINEQMLRYTFISSEIVGDSLMVKLQYGGGCVKLHEFGLVRTASTTSGEVNIYLLHKTLTDTCTSLIGTELSYGISSLLNDKTITSIKLNGERNC